MHGKVKDGDFGRKTRAFYIIGCMAGIIMSYYIRDISYSQKTTYCNKEYLFQNPWFFTMVMGFAMSFCLVAYIIIIRFDSSAGPKLKDIQFSFYAYALVPGLCDLFATVLYSASIITISGPVSVALFFFELFTIVILRTLLLSSMNYAYRWVALFIVSLGMIFVSFAVIKDAGKINHMNWISVLLQFIAQFLYAAKALSEEKILHNNDLHPLWLMGTEGIYEFLITLFMIYPITYELPTNKYTKSLHENLCKSFVMAFSSKNVIILLFIYIPICAFYNGCIGGTIQTSNSVNYILMENIGSSIVWIIDIIIFEGFHGKVFFPCYDSELIEVKKGSAWTKYGYMRIAGLLIFLIGELIYINVIKLPYFKYPEADVKIISMNLVLGEDAPNRP